MTQAFTSKAKIITNGVNGMSGKQFGFSFVFNYPY